MTHEDYSYSGTRTGRVSTNSINIQTNNKFVLAFLGWAKIPLYVEDLEGSTPLEPHYVQAGEDFNGTCYALYFHGNRCTVITKGHGCVDDALSTLELLMEEQGIDTCEWYCPQTLRV